MSNVQLCKEQGIAITSYYKQRALLSNPATSNFIQIKTTAVESQQLSPPSLITLNTMTGELAFPASIKPELIIAIINGLSS